MTKHPIFLLLPLALLLSPPARAADDSVNYGVKPPSEEELIKALTPGDAPSPTGYKSRAIRPVKVEKPAISLEIQFEKNSADLTPSGKQALDVLGKSLQSDRLLAFKFKVEGHTDASGSNEHNLKLSQARAKTVQDYLVQQYAVDSARLAVEGKGESELLDQADPASGRNRRVKIVNLGQ